MRRSSVPKKRKERGSGSPANDTLLALLREVYLAALSQGGADAVAIEAKPRRSLLRLALQEGLVKESNGIIELTPQGRRRLKVVMVGGAFEIIHSGHISALSQARDLGNTLVVVVATDESVQRNKGRPPVTSQELRVGLVSSLKQVDLALPGNKGSIFDILVKIRPDVVALGYDQGHSGEEIEREAARRGVQLKTARLGSSIPGIKTSKILLSM